MVIIMNSLDSIKRHVKLMVFLQKYGEGYGEELASIIKSEYKYYLRNLRFASVYFYQIFSYLDFFKDNKDVYRALLGKLQDYFSLESKILEIGCGSIPAFARLIDEEQQNLGSGTITAYDDALITDSLGNIELYKKKLTDEDVSRFDLLVSTFSCNATDKILAVARENKLPYFMHLCSCNHGFSSMTDWHNNIYHQAKMDLDPGAVLDLDSVNLAGKSFDYPILIKTYRGR